MVAQPRKSVAGRILKIFSVFLILAAISGGGYYYYLKFYAFPTAENPKAVTYDFQFKGQDFKIDEIVYQSIYAYYQRKPKGVFVGQETNSIAKYLDLPKEDLTIISLTDQVEQLAKQKGYDSDQTAELAVAFVQSIPYDFVKAQTDLTHPDYPYEVLFNNKGICSDKSFLADSILEHLGYGTAIFTFDKEEHMSAAISCPSQYSNFDSGYCMVETTSTGIKIGSVPDIKANNQAVTRTEIGAYQKGQDTATDIVKLSPPQIFAKRQGQTYSGIIKTVALEKQISDLSNTLATSRTTITTDETKLDSMKSELDTLKSQGQFDQYNALVPPYNSLLSQIQAEIKTYNANVDLYNKLIKQYN